MTDEERSIIIFEAIKRYGDKHQALVAIEEMSELTKEILKSFNRDENNKFNIIMEAADVLITLFQIVIISGSNEKEFFEAVDIKLERLKNRLGL